LGLEGQRVPRKGFLNFVVLYFSIVGETCFLGVLGLKKALVQSTTEEN